MKFDHYKKFINVALDLLLGLLAIVVVIFMLRYIIDIGSLILRYACLHRISGQRED